MQLFGVVVIGVLVVGIVVGLYAARNPPHWDELGGESPIGPEATQPSRMDDEADLRALVAEKRARRRAGGGPAVSSDTVSAPSAPWAHLEADLVLEARELVARRRARLESSGAAAPDERTELERLLGPP